MGEDKILELLLYCNVCYKNNNKMEITATSLYIGECMHMLCKNCIEDVDYCKICHKNNNFRIVNEDFKQKIIKNPTEMFIKPVELSMFHLSSALNLILHLKSEINMYKNLLKRAKTELDKVKESKNGQNMFKNSYIFDFSKEEKVNPHVAASKKVDKIYKNIENKHSLHPVIKKNHIINMSNDVSFNRNNKRPYTTINESVFNGSEKSFSSSVSSRLTIPKKESQYKLFSNRRMY